MYNLCLSRYNLRMDLGTVFDILHNAVESANNGKKISQKKMAETLGISMRTYQDWKLGNSQPQVAFALLKMLGRLDDEDMVRVVRKIDKNL